jgi:hypothetical protein
MTDWIDPLHGSGYQFWSGFGSDLGELSILVALCGILWATWRRHNCHVRGCPRIIWKPHGEHELCRKHHPHSPPTADQVAGGA